MNTLRLGNSEVRLHADGTVDEIVVRDANGTCLFHLEQMNDSTFWMAVYPDKGDGDAIHANVFSKNGRSHVTCEVSEAGSAITVASVASPA